jgi:hypothetical protein
MKTPRIIAVLVFGAFMAFSASIVFAQAQSADKPVSIAEVLKAAQTPMTDDQVKKLKDLQSAQGREAFMAISTLFDEKQTESLKKFFGTRPGRNNGPERPRALMQAIVLENAKCPLTMKQVDQIKAMAADQATMQAITDILTEAQKAAMQKAMGQ